MNQESCRSVHMCVLTSQTIRRFEPVRQNVHRRFNFLLHWLSLLVIMHIYGLVENVIAIELVLILAVNSSKWYERWKKMWKGAELQPHSIQSEQYDQVTTRPFLDI